MSLRFEDSGRESRLCAQCAKEPSWAAAIEDNLPDLPGLLKSNCDLCKFVGNVVLSKAAKIHTFSDDLTPLDNSRLPIMIDWFFLPEFHYMQILVRPLSVQLMVVGPFSLSCFVTPISGK